MKIKRVWSVYFSPTGTTKKIVSTIAEVIAQELNIPQKVVGFTLPKDREMEVEFREGDLVILGVPVYAGRVPNLLLSYLNEKLKGNKALGVPIVLFGNRAYDDALIELRDIMEKTDIRTVSAGAFVGEHSFSKILGAMRPDDEDLVQAEVLGKAIARKLAMSLEVPEEPVKVNGNFPYRPYYIPKDEGEEPKNILQVKPKTKAECIQCDLCANQCPMGAIDPSDVSHVIGICIKCGACVKNCPVEAKFFDDPMYLYHKTELEKNFKRRAEPELFY